MTTVTTSNHSNHHSNHPQIKLSATQGNTLTLEQIVKIQEQHVQQGAQLSHLALHVQCLQAENEKLLEAMEALNSAHRVCGSISYCVIFS